MKCELEDESFLVRLNDQHNLSGSSGAAHRENVNGELDL